MGVKCNYISGSGSEPPERGDGYLHETDFGLVGRARRGENSAFHELVDRHSTSLFRLAFLLVGNRTDAEDVVQETLLGAFQHLRRFRGHSSVKTWLTRILVKQAAMHRRSRSPWRTVALEEAGEEWAAVAEPSRSDSPVQQADTRMDVQAVLGTLSPEHRQVIMLREFEGMSYREISAALNMPCGTVESRLFRAREHLRKLLRGYE